MNQNTANAIAASVAALTETLRAERDALRAECELLRGEMAAQVSEKVRAIGLYGLASIKADRLLLAAQSLHRAWRRERDLVMRFRRDHDEWAVSPECGCMLCEETDRSHGPAPQPEPEPAHVCRGQCPSPEYAPPHARNRPRQLGYPDNRHAPCTVVLTARGRACTLPP